MLDVDMKNEKSMHVPSYPSMNVHLVYLINSIRSTPVDNADEKSLAVQCSRTPSVCKLWRRKLRITDDRGGGRSGAELQLVQIYVCCTMSAS